ASWARGEPQESAGPSARVRRLGERTALSLSNLLSSRDARRVEHRTVPGNSPSTDEGGKFVRTERRFLCAFHMHSTGARATLKEMVGTTVEELSRTSAQLVATRPHLRSTRVRCAFLVT